MKYIIFPFLLTSCIYSCQTNNEKKEIQPIQAVNALPELNSSNVDCDVHPIRNRKEDYPEKRIVNIYLLWNASKFELTDYEKRGEKLGRDVMKDLKQNDKKKAIDKIDMMIEKTRENKNNLIDVMPKMEELENLHELIYCYYLHSIDNLIQMRDIINTDKDIKTITNNLFSFSKSNETTDNQKWNEIRSELENIDKKYDLSKIKVQK